MHTLTFCVYCTRMKKDSADAIEILQKLHHVASLFIQNLVFIKLPSFQFHHLPDGLVVRIPGSHPGGPGSIPGLGTLSNTTSSSVIEGIAINQHGCAIFSDKSFLQSQYISNAFQFLIGRDFSIKTYFIYLSHSVTSITLT